ncbi:hypothetical protein HK105_204013 [Polyrhizophydium stewartii]|uniref:C2H2-type domain-containing protein n=1 Tax=Polyrhizophydium stewartii TaxID=2732419 RepID=A0ABR4NAM5_9FUNG
MHSPADAPPAALDAAGIALRPYPPRPAFAHGAPDHVLDPSARPDQPPAPQHSPHLHRTAFDYPQHHHHHNQQHHNQQHHNQQHHNQQQQQFLERPLPEDDDFGDYPPRKFKWHVASGTSSAQGAAVQAPLQAAAPTQAAPQAPASARPQASAPALSAGPAPDIHEASEGDDARAVKLFACPQCLKTFTRKYNLQSHLRCHTMERPFECHSCHATFVRKHDLQRHVRSLHTSVRPHTCPHCSLTFARSDGLKRHLETEAKIHGKALLGSAAQSLDADGQLAAGFAADPSSDAHFQHAYASALTSEPNSGSSGDMDEDTFDNRFGMALRPTYAHNSAHGM